MKLSTLTDVKNNIHTSLLGFSAEIENISEEVFKYEMEISHLHENSYYYIINYNKIYTSKGYNYILKNDDGNFYWATPGTKNFIESEHCPEFEIKTYSFYKLIDKQGNTYLDEYKNPILELEAEFKKVDTTKIYKPEQPNIVKNKVVDDYYISRYIYGLKYTLDTSTGVKNEEQFKDVNKSHIENLDKYFKQYHKSHEIKDYLKNKFDNLEKYVKEKYENETSCFIKFYINEPNKDKLKIHLDNIEKYVLDYYEAEARRILTYY